MTPDVGMLALGLAVALAPCLPLEQISHTSLRLAMGWMAYGGACLGLVWTAVHAPAVFPMGAALLYWWVKPPVAWKDRGWQPRDLLPTLIVWAVLAGLWAALAGLPRWGWDLLPWAWTAISAWALCLVVWQWYWVAVDPPEYAKGIREDRPWWHPYRPFHPGCAWFGQRSLAGAFFALLVPLAPTPVLFIPLLGVGFTSSGIGLLAAMAGLSWRWPWLLPWFACLVIAGWACFRWKPEWLDLTPRGNSLDSLKQRWQVLRFVVSAMTRREWWPWGYGPLGMERAIVRWGGVYNPLAVPLGQIHNDLLHHLFEYGLPAVASIAVLGYLVIPRLVVGDPWSAAWITGALLSIGTMPFRLPSIGLIFWAISVEVATR